MSQDIPNSFLCPITRNIMTNPYIDNEGNSYEYDAICKWLERTTTSPITRNYLIKDYLKPNRALLDAIKSANLIPDVKETENIINKFQPEDITVNLNLSKYVGSDKTYFKLDVVSHNGKNTAPVDIVAVIDVSGSMSSPAYIMQNGENKDVGFTILDITKHSLKMILESLTPSDRLSIITFSNTAKVLCDLTYITISNKSYLSKLIDTIKTEGATNIWDGINEGLKQFEKFNDTLGNRINTIMFLTDGIPSEYLLPPRGIINTLERKLANLKDNKTIIPTIYTYGFGYSLDTQLLVDIAKLGNGNFSFIPDSGFVGTVLINSLAYIKTTINKNVYLNLDNTCSHFLENANDYCHNIITNKKLLIKTIHYGHILSYIFEIDNSKLNECNKILNFRIVYDTLNNENRQLITGFNRDDCELITQNDIDCLLYKEKLINMLNTNKYDTLVNNINEYKKLYGNVDNDIVKDFNEQILQAINLTNYKRWGENYINSFRETHKDCRCNNFKDNSIQNYGGKLFKNIVENLNDLYDNLPAPVPSNKVYNDYGATRGTGGTGSTRGTGGTGGTPVINFSQSFNSQDNGCFHENTNIIMHDYSIIKIKNIKKGDKLLDMNNKVSTVVCVIKMKCSNNKCYFTEIKGLKESVLITPYHPVIDIKYPNTILKSNCEWIFPYTIGDTSVKECEYIYNLVLDTCHNIIAENTVCVTLGHNLTSNFVVSHKYLGTSAVINDLSKMNGYDEGLVYLEGNYVKRDEITGRIIQYKQ